MRIYAYGFFHCPDTIVIFLVTFGPMTIHSGYDKKQVLDGLVAIFFRAT